MKPIKITKENFESEVADSKLPVLVDFFASWCGPCRTLAPVIDEIAVEYSDKLKVVKIDIDANEELAATYRIAAIPTLALLESGKLTESLGPGVKPKSEIKSVLDSYLGVPHTA